MTRFFLTYNKDRLASWLNQKSQDGWALQGAAAGFYSFIPCKPGEYTYQIDFSSRAFSVSEGYRTRMEDLGVEIVTVFGPWIFLRESAAGPCTVCTNVPWRIDYLASMHRFFRILAVMEFIAMALLLLAADHLEAVWPCIFAAVAAVSTIALTKRCIEISGEIDALQKRNDGNGYQCRRQRMLLVTAIGLVCLLAGTLLPATWEGAAKSLRGAGIEILIGTAIVALITNRMSSH